MAMQRGNFVIFICEICETFNPFSGHQTQKD